MTETETDTAGEAAAIPLPEPGAARRRRRWPVVVLSVIGFLVVAVLVMERWQLNEYALTPGDAQPVGPLITVPARFDHTIQGSVLLTDVYETQLNVLTFLQERYFSSVAQVYSGADLIGSTPSSQYVAQGYLQMSQAQSAATAAALKHLGYTVSAQTVGLLVYQTEPGTPAFRALQVGQVITAINGKPITTQCGLVAALAGLHPGNTATLSVEQSYLNDVGTFVAGPVVQKSVTLGTPPAALSDAGCGAPTQKPTAFLGVTTETQLKWHFPVKVSVHTANIGGPSAGLAMTLGIIDKLSNGHLTDGKKVAATGTIDANGDVGDVGGVPQKTIAVERAGATIFFVPRQEYQAALSKDSPQLHIYSVSSLDQVLGILKRLGGTVGTSHATAEAAP